MKLQVSIGIGRPVNGMEEADESYRSALKALNTRLRTQPGVDRSTGYSGDDCNGIRMDGGSSITYRSAQITG
ncbi:hypothetical protein [Paenibacillus graminis]|uniref:hypothetical protein n=1 Tax=Paenibacillus graminis TaxID=189425 RepID=UPI003B5135EC